MTERDAGPPVEVRRSARRRKTVSAHREAGRVVVSIPSRFSRAEEARWVRRMLDRIAASDRRRRPSESDLARRAAALCTDYLDAIDPPSSVTWASNMDNRWGSCTPASRTVRISDRVQGMPAWVLDYVLLHELAHLVEDRHSARFWELVERYPRTERARGFLLGVGHAKDEG